MAMLRADLGTDLHNCEELINEVASTYVPPPPPTDEEHNEAIYFQIDQLELPIYDASYYKGGYDSPT